MAAKAKMGRETSELLELDSVTVTTATTPSLIAVAFMPLARHVTDPLLEPQVSVLSPAVRAGPVAAVRETTLAGSYDKVHAKPAGALPVEVFRERFKERELPAIADPDARLKEGVCPKAELPRQN